ncbi:MAG: hypothetical protein DIU68_011605 [Chloroflexota bacterium]|nr:MAG: hypothetical protein DIU68_02040 [Chloroflexota bacterium]
MNLNLYLFLRDAHNLLSQVGLGVAILMFVIAIYIGLIRRGDVTRAFRRGTFVVLGLMVVEMLLGLTMYLMGFRPAEEVHLIYGLGATLALPFFVYVEMTARKRPAMGSYIWGFGLLAAIILRAIMTGA